MPGSWWGIAPSVALGLGTPTTINSNAYARNIHALNPDLHVYSQACPLFVPLVEEGWLDHEVTRLTAMVEAARTALNATEIVF